MKEPRFDFGVDVSNYSMSGMTDLDFMQSGEWLPESDISSKIEVIPSAGFVKKSKERSADLTVYEAASTLFFSELLNLYSSLLPDRDFSLYSPQTVRLLYGEKDNKKSRQSSLYQLLCPGRPFNKLPRKKQKIVTVQEEPVRIENRAMYLGGIMYQILRNEGVLHGDPQMRHFFMMPMKGNSYRTLANGGVSAKPTKNGLGVIDVEGARVLGPNAEEVKKESNVFQERMYKSFGHAKGADQYFAKGQGLVRKISEQPRLAELAQRLSKNVLDTMFDGIGIEHIDMAQKKVIYTKK